jgi:hypothetical protein
MGGQSGRQVAIEMAMRLKVGLVATREWPVQGVVVVGRGKFKSE